MTTPVQRIKRLLDEGATFMVQIPGQISIDLTPDVIAAIDGVQSASSGVQIGKESIEPTYAGRDIPTRVQFP
jgi:hypothetical protein